MRLAAAWRRSCPVAKFRFFRLDKLDLPEYPTSYITLGITSSMSEFLIKYRDGSGEVTERRISDLRLESAGNYDAFCHLRKARRPFRMDRIVHAVNPDTGEILNPYSLLPNSDSSTLEALTWRALPAIKALKFFTLSTRGFAKREKERVADFVREVADVARYTKEELEEWLYKLWCGDLYAYRDGDTTEYTETLKAIPREFLPRCRDYALLIARGSGRNPVDPAWVERTETEFCNVPNVKKPQKSENEGIGVVITVGIPNMSEGKE